VNQTVQAQAVAVTAANVQRIGQRLPSAPQVFRRIGDLLSDPNSSIDQIVDTVKLDAALALRILQLSNAVCYGYDTACKSLDEAINRLGFREVYRVVGVVASQHLYCREFPVHQVSGQQVWENSLASALAMEWLTRQRGGDEPGAYAIGLLRSVGKIVLSRLMIERPTIIVAYPGEAVEPVLHAWERRMFGMSGMEIGASLMQAWKFPPRMYEAVRLHLEPEAAVDLAEAHRLNLAGWIAEQLGKGLLGESRCLQPRTNRLQRAGVTEPLLQTCIIETRTALNEVLTACR
jgi:HD-like signal output (HDOD) protein